jgi:hypothetical protein
MCLGIALAAHRLTLLHRSDNGSNICCVLLVLQPLTSVLGFSLLLVFSYRLDVTLEMIVKRISICLFSIALIGSMSMAPVLPAADTSEDDAQAKALESEALAEVTKDIATIFSHCGEFWYAEVLTSGSNNSLTSLWEIKGLRIYAFTSDNLDDLARLNGYEWRGGTEVETEMSRHYQFIRPARRTDSASWVGAGSWEDWDHGSPSFMAYSAEKKKGVWHVVRQFIRDGLFHLVPPQCSRIPPG